MAPWFTLYKKDLTAELRRPQFLLGVVFFQFCLLFLFFLFQDSNLNAMWWGNLFWVNLLIAAMSLVLKNFSSESTDQYAYYFQISDALTIYLSKTLYNFTLLLVVAIINFILFQLLFEPKTIDFIKFSILVLSGIVGLSLSLTLVAFIAGFGQNASVLINILVLPIIIPILLLLIRSTSSGVAGFYTSWSGDISIILGIDILMLAMGIGLFPYLWRR
jgi:heme exporter protein B